MNFKRFILKQVEHVSNTYGKFFQDYIKQITSMKKPHMIVQAQEQTKQKTC